MTEDQARTKWCPMARVGSDTSGRGSLNRDWAKGPNTHSTQCAGSACMMWRWHSIEHPREFPHENARTELSKTDGYCGLAGAP